MGSVVAVEPPRAERIKRMEQRRSPRAKFSKPLPCFVDGIGPATVQSLSLGGATIVSRTRPRESSCRARLVYQDTCVDVRLVFYRTVVQELFYSTEGDSRIRFASSVTFDDPSVATLNLLYRIIGDFWSASGEAGTNRPDR